MQRCLGSLRRKPQPRLQLQTTDAGKECHDGDECQGLCLFRRYDNEAREEGVCSETQRMSGCHAVVMKGQSQLKPRIPPPKKLPTCLD